MKTRFWVGGAGVFVLLLVTILASIFGWGLPPASRSTTMVENVVIESQHSRGAFHLWHAPSPPPVSGHHHEAPALKN